MKKTFKFFTIFEYEKEQEYLRQMHNAGWRFVKVTGLGIYHFEPCTPEDVIYQLDYNQEGLKHKAEYVQMFCDCGWEYLQDFVGYSYFRKPASQMNGDEGIFCDADSHLQMMERVFKGRLIPLAVIFSAVLIPQFVLQLSVFHNYLLAAFLGGLIAVYLFIFSMCAVKYGKFKEERK